MINYFKTHKHELILVLIISIYVLYFTTASFLRFDNFFTGRFDLGNMDQTVWNTLHGRIFQMTDPNGTNTISRLAFHADFLLILITPLYLIWSNPQMLLLLQTLVLGFGALFVFLIAKNVIKDKNLALIFSIVYLLNPSLQFTNLYDFHAVTLATTFLLATFYFFIKRNYLLFLLSAILAGLTKEEIWAIISMFGLAIILRNFLENKLKLKFSKKQILELAFGLLITVSASFVCYFLLVILIPHIRGSGHFALAYYSDFGSSASDISKNIILSPLKTISAILTVPKIHYLIQLLLPAGFLSLLSPILLVFALPDLLINLLSNNSGLYEIYYQYTAAITPFILISSIYGAKLLRDHFPKIKNQEVIIYLILVSLISAYLYGPLPGGIHANVAMFTEQLANGKTIDNFLVNIPTRYSIAASNNLGSHLSHRKNIYTIPIGIGQADVILFLLNDNFAQPSLKAQKEMAKQMSNDKNYIQVYKDGDFVAFEKRTLYKNPKTNPKKGQEALFPYSITALSNRDYEASDIKIEKEIPASGDFKSYIIVFTVGGLKEYTLMNVPKASPPASGFPVLIIDHGYIQPSAYDTASSYKAESDYFANHGFLVLKPDYRGNANSEITDTALMRFAYPIDVLTLLSSVDNIPQANKKKVFFWSHSMGGEVTLEVLESVIKNKNLSTKIKGAIFWAPVTDPVKWFSKNHLSALPEATISPYPYTQTFQLLGTPEENPQLWQSLSPLNYLKNINVPILLQHGTADATVPYSWSVELNTALTKLGKNIKFISYPDDNHNLPLHWQDAVTDDMTFFNSL